MNNTKTIKKLESEIDRVFQELDIVEKYQNHLRSRMQGLLDDLVLLHVKIWMKKNPIDIDRLRKQ